MEQQLQPAGGADHPPDWAIYADDIPCPRCGYNLRELPRPLCPECGLEFTWSAVLDQAHTRLNPLFEYQWKNQPVRSFFRSTWWLLRPMRFWRRLPITDRPGDLSLAIQFLGTVLFSAVILYAIAFARHIEIYWRYQGGTGPLFKYPWMWYVTDWTDRIRHVLVSLCSIGLIVTFILAIFWQTLGKYRIRRNVAMRVGAYALFTLVVWWTLVWTVTNLADMTTLVFTRSSTWRISYYITSNHLASAVAVPCFFLCLGAGLRTHLGIPGGWRLAALAMLTTSVIVAFIVIQSALVTGTFDPWANRVTRCYLSILPRFWGY